MDNYHEVIHQMEAFGIEIMPKDLPLVIDHPKRKTFGKKGKAWYWLRTFRPDAGGAYIVGAYGSYKTGESQKVEVDWKPLSDAERKRREDERQAAEVRKAEARAEESAIAALSAGELWCRAMREGRSPYLERKQVTGESCRYLPNGTLVVPLLRYDLPRDQALRAVQRILPDGAKFYTKGFDKPGCAVRLGQVADDTMLILVCEGYVTGLSIRMALEHLHPVFVGLDAGNLQHVVGMLRTLYPEVRLLICADDDWRTRDRYGNLNNPGLTTARRVAKETSGCDIVFPVFDTRKRGEKDTDFNDLHILQGLPAVRRQLRTVIVAMERQYG